MKTLTVISPVFNEEQVIEAFYTELKTVLASLSNYDAAMLFVVDRCSDRTLDILEQIANVDPRVKVLSLSSRFGHQMSLLAGIDHADSDALIMMDSDLQHPPSLIPTMLGKFEEGYDVVSGWRAQRADNFIMRRIPSRAANWLMATLSGVNIHDFGTTFKAYRREVIHNIPLYGEMHRFIPALASWYGASICEIPISNPARLAGKSHYGISRTFRVFFDLLTIRFLLKYMTRPLHFFGTIGALSAISGSGLAAWLLILKLLTDQPIMDIHGPLFVVARKATGTLG